MSRYGFWMVSLGLGLVGGMGLAGSDQTAGDPPELSVLDNAGFDDGLAEWDFRLGWKKLPADQQAKYLSIQRGRGDRGRYLRVSNSHKDRFIGVQQNVKWQANTYYTLSYLVRGRAKAVKHERGMNRIRVWGLAGPEYMGNASYDQQQWTRREYRLYCPTKSGGGVSLWVWPDGVCEIDNLVLRPALWRTDESWYRAGTAPKLEFTGPRRVRPGSVTLRTSDGRALQSWARPGRTIRPKTLEVGYYRAGAVTTLDGQDVTDQLGICVISEQAGLDAVRDHWD
jgi:hypothetical protein